MKENNNDNNITKVEPVVEPKEEVKKDAIPVVTGVVLEKKPSKTSVLVAQILVVVILLATVGLGLFKFADYLSKPKTLFYSVINDTYADFSNLMTTISNDKLYTLLNSKAVKVNADTKMVMSGLESTGNASVQTMLNSYSLKTSTQFDKTNKYFDTVLNVNEGEATKYNVTFVDNDYKNYFKFNELYDKFIALSFESINFDQIDPSKNIFIGNIVKSEFLKMLNDDNFVTTTDSVQVDSNLIDCKVNSYTFTGSELNTLIDNIVTSIKNDSNSLYYIAELYGKSATEVTGELDKIKEVLNIDENTEYTFSAYTKDTTDETIRFTINHVEKSEEGNFNVVVAYTTYQDYARISYEKGQESDYISIKGDLADKSAINIKNSTTLLEIESNLTENANEGSIKMTDLVNDSGLLEGKFTYQLTETNSTTASVALTLNLEIASDDKPILFEINSALLINSGVSIAKVDTADSVEIDHLTTDELTTIMNNLTNILGIQIPTQQ